MRSNITVLFALLFLSVTLVSGYSFRIPGGDLGGFHAPIERPPAARVNPDNFPKAPLGGNIPKAPLAGSIPKAPLAGNIPEPGTLRRGPFTRGRLGGNIRSTSSVNAALPTNV